VNRGEILTPAETAGFMVERLGEVGGKRILEPGAGEGVFIRELLRRGAEPAQITALDTNPHFERIYKGLASIAGLATSCFMRIPSKLNRFSIVLSVIPLI